MDDAVTGVLDPVVEPEFTEFLAVSAGVVAEASEGLSFCAGTTAVVFAGGIGTTVVGFAVELFALDAA